MRSKIKNTAALAALLISAWASLATSQKSASIDNGQFYINSDCVSPAREAVIKTVANQIISPPGTNYTDFGFPNNIVKLDSTNTGVVGAATRECVQTYGDTSTGDDFIFSCQDNGQYVCSIIIQNY